MRKTQLPRRRSWLKSQCMQSLLLAIMMLLLCYRTWSTAAQRKSEVCIVTSDFWGLPAAGGTATAYHLLASSIAKAGWPVTFLGATQQTELCQEIQSNWSSSTVRFECLQPKHFEPRVVETFPYEAIGIALVRWLTDQGKYCDVIHAHEWGGGMQQLAAVISLRRSPGLRLIIEPHGGHYWSSQGSRQRPTDLFTLRVDDHERMTMHLADSVKSPSAYMLAHLRQRSFRLPPSSSVISNIVPSASASSDTRQRKEVWRLAFFGRLEARKGLVIFCDAIERMDASKFPRLEVDFIGGAAQVDMMPSMEYLQMRTKTWSLPVHIHIGLQRTAALLLLKRAGVMVVFTSMVENSPFALAETCIEEIPFVTFRVGGVAELIDPTEHADVVLPTVSADLLFESVHSILRQGWLQTSVLSDGIKNGEKLWQTWHRAYDKSKARRLSDDTPSFFKSQETVEVLTVYPEQDAQVLKRNVCKAKPSDGGLLLVPSNFDQPSQADQFRFLTSQMGRLYRDHGLGALVFGAVIAAGDLVSYPSSPTWILYHGTEPMCVSSVPLLLLKSTFCSSFLPEAGDFLFYHSWLLIHHLHAAGLASTAYPDPVFILNNFTEQGVGCLPDRIPEFRRLAGNQASNLLGLPEDVLMVRHLAPWPQPAASLRADFGKYQGQRSWRYLRLDKNGDERELAWEPASSNITLEGSWRCHDSSPTLVTQSSMHPCASTDGQCCEGDVASVGLQYVSTVHDVSALIELTFEVWPSCGDGLNLTLTLEHNHKEVVLYSKHFAMSHAPPHRESVETSTAINPGHKLTLVVDAGSNHDCDGVYLHDFRVWDSSTSLTNSHAT